MRTRLIGLAALCSSACSGPSLGGSVDGHGLTMNSTAAQATTGEVSFVLSSADDVCSDLMSTTGEPGTTNLAILIRSLDDAGTPQAITTGEYDLGATTGQFATASFQEFSSDCTTMDVAAAAGGSITVTTFDPTEGSLSGTLDLDFTGSDHLTGSFTVAPCGTYGSLRCPIVRD
jgi:hypothetical protein